MYRILFIILAISLHSCGKTEMETKTVFQQTTPAKAIEENKTKEYTVKIIRQIPHSTESYTQGLILSHGHLIESTGLKGASSIQKINPENGNVLDGHELSSDYFAEGIAEHDGKIFQLTWQDGTCFVYDAKSLSKIRNYSYYGEGWGLASDGEKFYMSDGSFVLKFINPKDFSFIGSKMIHYKDGRPAYDLNELEFAQGFLWANIWQTDLIAKIDTTDGKIIGLVDLSPLREAVKINSRSEVSNGIAYNEKTKTFFLTGKYWPFIFEVEVVEK